MLWPCVRLSVCHSPKFNRNAWTDRAGFRFILHFVQGIRVTLSQTVNVADFPAFSPLHEHVDHCKCCCQLRPTVTRLWHAASTHHCWQHVGRDAEPGTVHLRQLSLLLWPPYVIGGIVFLPCIFFYLSVCLSVCLSICFFSSPNLSGRRLDIYHTLTHGVALVRI